MIVSLLTLIGGVVVLTVAADRAVESAEELSIHLGISPTVVGALIVGLGTSLPEMVVSGLAAADRDTIDLAIGNIVGSNAANLTLVLGTGAIITMISGQRAVMRREGLLMVAGTALFTAFAIDDHIDLWESLVLLAASIAATGMIVIGPNSMPGIAADLETDTDAATGLGGGGESRSTVTITTAEVRSSLFWSIAGLVGVLAGAQLMVRGAVDIAEDLGASEAFVGLTIVAIGTSLPELATIIASARRGSIDLVVGNVVGSNLFNSLAVGGLAGLVGTGIIDESMDVSMVLMLAISVGVVAWGATGRAFDRVTGALLVISYGVLVASGA